MPQAGQEATSTDKPITKFSKNMSEAGYRCVCLNEALNLQLKLENLKEPLKKIGR